MPEYYGPDIITTLAKRLRPYLLGVGESLIQANEWDKIILIVADGGGTSFYDPDATGFSAAVAAASSGDVIFVPPATISGDYTIPAGVEIWGAGRDKTILSGEITLSGNSILSNLSVIQSVDIDHESTTKGIIGTSSGISYIYECNISITNAGVGDINAIDQPAGGTTEIWGSNIQAVNTILVSEASNVVQDLYAIYVTNDGEVIHRFCNLRAAQDSTQRNPLFDTVGSSFSTGGTVSSGNFVVTASAGTAVSGLIVGNWYALENTGGPWDNGDVSSQYRYSWDISFDGGTTWGRIEDMVDGGTRYLYTPPGVEHTEASGSNYARIYFKAIATSIIIRVADRVGNYGDNTDSMGYLLTNATVELDATEAYASDIVDPVGATASIPHLGDRAAYDVDDYDTKHASDIYNGLYIRHLPTAGTVNHVPVWNGTSWAAGTVSGGTASGGGSVSVLDEGVLLGTASALNFVGNGATASFSGGTATITHTASGGGGSVIIYDEGVVQGTVDILDFVGTSVSAAVSGGTATITHTASGGGGSVIIYDEGVVQGTVDIFNFIGDGVSAAVSGGTANISIAGTWTDFSSSSTVAGWSSFTSKYIYYKEIGNLIYVNVFIEGTSNSASTTFTIPYSNGSGTYITVANQSRNNGTFSIGLFQFANGTNVVNCLLNASSGTWTASGSKRIAGQFWYEPA